MKPESTIMENICSTKEAFTTLLMEQFNAPQTHNINNNHIECLEQVGWTPLIEIEPNLYAKLEGENYSGSAKDRAIISMIYAMYLDNKLKQNDTICLVTSGSAARSLLMLHKSLQQLINIEFDIICVIPSAYKQKPIVQSILNNIPTDNGRAKLVFPDGLFVDILTKYKQMCNDNGWIMLDQHYDYNASIGHRTTGIEIKKQFDSLNDTSQSQIINDIVVPTGTGATMTGIKHILKRNGETRFHSRKSLSLSCTGAVIDGLSDVNKYNNFCDSTTLNGYNNKDPFNRENALQHQKRLESEYGIEASLSSGASYWLAREIQAKSPGNSIVFVCPDGKRSNYANKQTHQEILM